MAKKEGWFSKNGSKWQTMPDLMLRYRAAAFWGRLYVPEYLVGIKTQEEVIDIEPQAVESVTVKHLNETISTVSDLNVEPNDTNQSAAKENTTANGTGNDDAVW